METFSALLAICAGNSPVTGEFPAQRPVTRSLMFSLIFARINGWANNHEASDLRRHLAHYNVIVMQFWLGSLNFTESLYQKFQLALRHNNDFAPNRRQATIQTNDDLVHTPKCVTMPQRVKNDHIIVGSKERVLFCGRHIFLTLTW